LAPSFAQAGDFTYSDILTRVSKAGTRILDQNSQYASFDQSVQKLEDVQEGMTLEGVVDECGGVWRFC